jgi:hypothetical protein
MGNIVPKLAIIATLTAAVIAASIALYVRRKNRTQNGKDVFGVFIREKIGALPGRGVKEFYTSTKPEVRVHVERVKHFLKSAEVTSIDRLWKEYNEITDEELDEALTREIAMKARPEFGEWQHPRKIIHDYLEAFHRLSQ